MVSFLPFAEKSLGGPGDYVLGLAPLKQELGLVASVSDNSLHLLPYDPLAFKTSSGEPSLQTIKNAHSSTITAVKSVSENVVASSGGSEGLRLWDLRTAASASKPVMEFKPANAKQGILSIDALGNFVAAGTELVGVDAGVYVWDIRNAGSAAPAVSYVDSHNDDVTDIKFHPHDHQALLSGSTDGLVNVYNTSISDEDEAVYQTINHGASIHSSGFLADKRLYALSHMETLSIYQVASPDIDAPEPKPVEFGDVRERWGCEYVIDMLPGYVAVGNHGEDQPQTFRLIPFANEQADMANAIEFKGAHGEEVVRAVYVDDRSSGQQCVYSGGEDGVVRVWKASGLDSSASFFSATPWASTPAVEKMDVDEEGEDDEEEKSSRKKHKKDKSEKKEKKDKKDKKEKKDKSRKEKKDKKEHRYKPY